MTINRSQLKFHETFQPETVYLAKICELASNGFAGTKVEISEATGIPTGKQKGKVEPHIKYASFMNLIDYHFDKGVYDLSLTKLGKEVFVQDRYLHENLTHWLCHYNISRMTLGAPQWYYLVHKGHTGYYQTNSSDFHLNKANDLFGTNVDLEEMFGVVKRSYIDGFFSDIHYVNWNDNIEFVRHTTNPELLFVYAYCILDSWEQLYPSQKEITMTMLLDSIGIGRIFNLDNEEVGEITDELEYAGLIKVNKQLYPATIICLASIEDVISALYSRLL